MFQNQFESQLEIEYDPSIVGHEQTLRGFDGVFNRPDSSAADFKDDSTSSAPEYNEYNDYYEKTR